MRSFVVTHITSDGGHRLISHHLTRTAAQRRAAVLRDILADLWAALPLDGLYMGAFRVMTYRDWMEVEHRR